jgi:hypothetical protein
MQINAHLLRAVGIKKINFESVNGNIFFILRNFPVEVLYQTLYNTLFVFSSGNGIINSRKEIFHYLTLNQNDPPCLSTFFNPGAFHTGLRILLS